MSHPHQQPTTQPLVVKPVTANTIGLGILLGAIYVTVVAIILGLALLGVGLALGLNF